MRAELTNSVPQNEYESLKEAWRTLSQEQETLKQTLKNSHISITTSTNQID